MGDVVVWEDPQLQAAKIYFGIRKYKKLERLAKQRNVPFKDLMFEAFNMLHLYDLDITLAGNENNVKKERKT